MWSDIIVFAIAVISHWQGYVTGGAITGLVALVERLLDWTMPKWAYAVLYVGVFLLVSFFLAWREQYHEAQRVPVLQSQLEGKDKEIKQLKEQPAQVQVYVPPSVVNLPPQMAYMASTHIGLIDYRIGNRIAVSSECKNLSQSIPAEDAACGLVGTYVVDVAWNEMKQPIVAVTVQDKIYSLFEKTVPKQLKLVLTRTTYGPGESKVSTGYSEEVLDQPLDDAFKSNKKTILFVAEYDWRDGLGRHINQLCTWLVPEGGPIQKGTWGSCKHHNGLQSH